MFRKLQKTLPLAGEVSTLPFTIIPVRGYRKPLWLGTAPSKKFRVPVRKHLPVEEKIELDRIMKNFKCYTKGILAYHAELNAKKSVTDPQVIEEQRRIEEEDWERSNYLNNEWNAEVAAQREQRIAIEKEEKKERIFAEKRERELKEKEEIEKAELAVKAEIEKSKSFITRDNIDEHIEQALSSHIDYNYAIDIQGNVYSGRKANPLNTKLQTSTDVSDSKLAAKN